MKLDLGDTQLIIETAKKYRLLRNQLAYVLATAYHETAFTMKPVMEAMAKDVDQAIARLEYSWKRGRMPWVKTPYWRKDANGKSWLGRGYVQMTWEDNYEKAEEQLNLELTDNPDVVMQAEIAVLILIEGMQEGWFTAKKLDDYITLQRSDFVDARRIINGTDKATTIAGYAKQYDILLKESGYGQDFPVCKSCGKPL